MTIGTAPAKSISFPNIEVRMYLGAVKEIRKPKIQCQMLVFETMAFVALWIDHRMPKSVAIVAHSQEQ